MALIIFEKTLSGMSFKTSIDNPASLVLYILLLADDFPRKKDRK